MNFTQLLRRFLIPSLLLISALAHAQDKVTVAATIDKNKIVIGEQVHLALSAYFPLHEPMRFYAVDSIAHFEILDRRKIDTVDNNEGIRLTQTLTLTSFDSGHWVMPPFELPGDKPLDTDSLTIDVGFAPFDQNQDYHDIKDIIDVKPDKKKKAQDWYIYAAISFVLVGGIIYVLTRKKKKIVAASVPTDPYKEAVQELEKLRKENLPSKVYYTRLTDAFRLYLLRREGILSLQETTEDLIAQLKQLKLQDAVYESVAQALRMGDSAKFAKYEPTQQDRQESLTAIVNTVDIIEKNSKVVQNIPGETK